MTDTLKRFQIDTRTIVVKRTTQYLLNYIAYSFLTWVVGISIFMIGLIQSAITYSIPPSFMNFLFMIYPKCADSCSEKEVMIIFGAVTLIIWIIVSVLKFLVEKIIHKKITVSLKNRIRYGIIFMTILFIGSLISMPYVPTNEDSSRAGFYIIIIICYVISIICITAYIFLKWIAMKVMGLTLTWPQ